MPKVRDQLTLTEFILRKLWGKPVTYSMGRPAWRCPFHGDSDAALYLYEPKDDGTQKWYCHGCGRFGDIHDAIRHEYPFGNYYDREALISDWRRSWKRQEGIKPKKYKFETVADAFAYVLMTKYPELL